MSDADTEQSRAATVERWIESIWYRDRPGPLWLWPLELLFTAIARLRLLFYRWGVFSSRHPGVPVIVVGNIAVGGAGKTPVVAWLANALSDAGFHPAVVSRGFGGSHRGSPLLVSADSDPELAGDEPVMLAGQISCPIVVSADRYAAARMAVSEGADVILSDDGLQHLALARDIEIAVVDAARGVGNGALLPRGPLRESPERLNRADYVLVNGERWGQWDSGFELVPGSVDRLGGHQHADLTDFAGKCVHALAGIGNPNRFYRLLEANGVTVRPVSVPDHGRMRRADLDSIADATLMMTAKDAVKYEPDASCEIWVVNIKVRENPGMQAVRDDIVRRLKGVDR